MRCHEPQDERETHQPRRPAALTPQAAAAKYAAMDDTDLSMRYAAALMSLALDDTLVRTAALPADEDDRVEHGERWDMQE